MAYIIIGDINLSYFQINNPINNTVNSYSKNIFTILIYGETYKVINYTTYETVLTFNYIDVITPYLTSAALLYQYLIDNQYFILVNIIIPQEEIVETINVNLTGNTFNVHVLTMPEVEVKNDAGSPLSITGIVSISNLPIIQDVNIISSVELEIKNDVGNPIPVSVASLPLPAGAATSANQITEIASLASIDAGIPVALGQTTMINSMPVVLASNQTVIPISAVSLPLPVGAATSANQITEIASLASIDAGIPVALGQTTMINSMPVVLASDQTILPVSIISASTAARSYNSRNMGAVPIAMPLALTNYVAIGIRLKVVNILNIVNIISLVVNVYTNDNFLWTLTENPTFAVLPVWTSFSASSYVETTVGAGGTITALGNIILSGYSNLYLAAAGGTDFKNIEFIQLKAIAGVPINYVLTINPLTPASTNLASLNWFQI